MSLQNSLFDIVPPQTLRKPESDTDWGDDKQKAEKQILLFERPQKDA